MADASEKPPVVDSREPGFNPEVEASHAAAAAGEPEPPAPPPPPEPEPPKPRGPEDIIRDLENYVRDVHGSHPRFEELMAELWKMFNRE